MRMKTMKASLLFVLAATAAFGGNAMASAQDNPATPPAPDWQVAYNVGAQSDYIFRGISQTNQKSSGFAGVDATYKSQLYVGAWTSNVDFSPSGDASTEQEYDLYGGWRPTIAGFNVDLGYIYYGYTHQPHGLRESYSELYLKVSHAIGPVTLGVAAYDSPDFPGITGRADYYEANIAYAFNPAWAISGAVGRQFESNALVTDDGRRADFNYSTWNAGVTYMINDHVSLDLRYWDTDQHATGDIYHSHVVAALKAMF
jgi:uncharacterized protein (TIGR02001 family)